MMTDSQAHRLHILVRESKTLNYEIPHGRRLALLFYPGKVIGQSQSRAATAVVQRLKKFGCLRKHGTKRFIDVNRLVTERVSASYVLRFRDECIASPSGTIDKETFHKRLLEDASSGFSPEALDEIHRRALDGEYLMEIPATRGNLRVGGHLTDQLPYLQLLLSDGVSR
jgi:hypothetical protein